MSPPDACLDVAFRGSLGRFALDVAFRVPARGVIGLFGPSGCGKTTTLRCMAGITRLPGRLDVAGSVWQDGQRFLEPHERPVGFVFQDASLFPHLSVRGNLMFGANRVRRAPPGRASIKEDEVIALLGLAPLLKRSTAALSGGEKQRVAIGRALLSQPEVLLLDEPLSALDRAAREEIFPYLQRLHQLLAIPCVYVTHDMAELDRLADVVVLMERGRVLAVGAPGELEVDPALPLLWASDAAVTLDGEVVAVDRGYGLLEVAVDGAVLTVPSTSGAPGAKLRVRVKAADVSLALAPIRETSILNSLPARILATDSGQPGSAHVQVIVGLGEQGQGARIVARITRKSMAQLGLRTGVSVFALVKSVALTPTC